MFFCLVSIVVYNCFSFPIDECYYIRSPEDVMKIGDKIAVRFNDSYQIRDVNEFVLNSEGWYTSKYCGTDMYLIFGSNFFVYHSSKNIYYPDSPSKFNFGSSYLSEDDYQKYIEGNRSWQLRQNSSVKFPDYLEEFGKNGKIIYDGLDATHFYYFCTEVDVQLFKYNSIPWATSVNPVELKLEVDLLSKKDSFVILNGYVHPDKRYLYKANRRLKQIKVTSPESEFSIIVDFEDVVHFQEIEMPEQVKTVTIEILDFYEGNKYKDLCIQMIGNKNLVYESDADLFSFSDLSYNGDYKEYKD